MEYGGPRQRVVDGHPEPLERKMAEAMNVHAERNYPLRIAIAVTAISAATVTIVFSVAWRLESQEASWAAHAINMLGAEISDEGDGCSVSFLSDTPLDDKVFADTVPHLHKLRPVKTLSFAEKQIGNQTFARAAEFDELERLYANGNNITDEGLGRLRDLKRLQVLYVRGTRVTAAGVATLQRALPNCFIASDFGPTQTD